MENDEILKRMKRHYIFFEGLKDKVDENIIKECIQAMEKLFLDLLKSNIRPKL